MGDLSGYKTEVANAQAGWNEFKAALHSAIQTEKNASNTLAQAQAEFYQDMSNSDAADAVVAAHQSLMEASVARKDAEQAFQSSQQTLTSAQQNLNGAQQMARTSVNVKAQQSYDEFLRQRAETRGNEQAGGQAGEPETVPPDQTTPYNVSNEGKEGNPLAPGNERDIMGEGTQGENAGGAGDAGKTYEQAIDDTGETYYKDEQLKTEPDNAYFWSGNSDGIGGKEFAREFANENGGTTLEKLLDEQGIILTAWDVDNPASLQAWRSASAKYAQQASGVVHVLLGSKINPNGVWKTIELKELMNNPNVTKIIQIDPKTLIETIVFER